MTGAAEQIKKALSPAIERGAAELTKSAKDRGEKLGEAYRRLEAANDKLAKATTPEEQATAIMEMANAVPVDVFKDLYSLLESGFQFVYPEWTEAARDLCARSRN